MVGEAKKGFSLPVSPSNLPIDYRDEENTFTNEDTGEAKILVPLSGPSGEVSNMIRF